MLFAFFFSIVSLFSALLASVPLELQNEINSLAVALRTEHCPLNKPYGEAKAIDLVFNLYLVKKRGKNDIVSTACFLHNFLVDYLTKFHSMQIKWNLNLSLPPLSRIDYLIDPMYVDIIEKRNIEMKKFINRFKEPGRQLAQRFEKVVTMAVACIRESMDNLPAVSVVQHFDRYLSNFQIVRILLENESYKNSTLTAGEVFDELRKHDTQLHSLIHSGLPLKFYIGHAGEEAYGIQLFFYNMRDLFFPDDPESHYNLYQAIRQNWFLRAAKTPVLTKTYNLSDLQTLILSRISGTDDLLKHLKTKLNEFSDKLDDVMDNWEYWSQAKAFTKYALHVLETPDQRPLTVVYVIKAALLLESIMCFKMNLDQAKPCLGLDETTLDLQSIVKMSRRALDAETKIRQKCHCVSYTVERIEGVWEIIAIGQAYLATYCRLHLIHNKANKTKLNLDSAPLLVFVDLLKEIESGALTRQNVAELSTSFCQSERKKLGLTTALIETKDIDSVALDITGPIAKKALPPPIQESDWDESVSEEDSSLTASSDEIEPITAIPEAPAVKSIARPRDVDEPAVINEGQPNEAPKNSLLIVPTQFKFVDMLIQPEDYDLLSTTDAVDIAHAYLMIGNHIHAKFLYPFLRHLEAKGVSIIGVFKRSIRAFQNEIAVLRLGRENLVDSALNASGLETMARLYMAIKYYERRLAVAHPYVPASMEARAFLVRSTTQALGYSIHSSFGSGHKLLADNKECLGIIEVGPKSFEECWGRDKLFEISLLFVSELYRTKERAETFGGVDAFDERRIRGKIAHYVPTSQELEDSINIFKSNEALFTFLKTI